MKVDFRQRKYLIREPALLSQRVCQLSGFQMKKLIYQGEVRRTDWIGSLVYEGTFKNKKAILKIQGLPPAIEEPEIMTKFVRQNRSRLIRTPKIFWHQPWNKKDKFGAFIMEKITAPQIFVYPYANQKQQNLFLHFYDRFHSRALNKPWERIKPNEKTNLDFFRHRLKRLKAERPDIKLPQEDQKRIKVLAQIINKIPKTRLIFTHGHLGADDIRCDKRQFILMSNLAWGYKPLAYDTMFVIWGCLHKIRDGNFSLVKARQLVNQWFNTYQKSIYLQSIKNWWLHAKYSLLFFILASIILQLYSDEHKRTATKKELQKLFQVHRQLFDELLEDLS